MRPLWHFGKKKEPLPGGDGVYRLRVEGMSCMHCRTAVENALNAFDGVTAQADEKTGIVTVQYKGLPDLDFLDKLSAAVAEAGYTVKEVL